MTDKEKVKRNVTDGSNRDNGFSFRVALSIVCGLYDIIDLDADHYEGSSNLAELTDSSAFRSRLMSDYPGLFNRT